MVGKVGNSHNRHWEATKEHHVEGGDEREWWRIGRTLGPPLSTALWAPMKIKDGLAPL